MGYEVLRNVLVHFGRGPKTPEGVRAVSMLSIHKNTATSIVPVYSSTVSIIGRKYSEHKL